MVQVRGQFSVYSESARERSKASSEFSGRPMGPPAKGKKARRDGRRAVRDIVGESCTTAKAVTYRARSCPFVQF
jgi:hypothetical protein